MLLMDEPFGALDHQTRELMQELLLGIWEEQRKTVIFVTHDIDEAVFMGSRVLVMSARPGRIKLDREVPIAHPRHYSIKTTPLFMRAEGRADRAGARGGARRAGGHGVKACAALPCAIDPAQNRAASAALPWRAQASCGAGPWAIEGSP